VPLAAVHHRVEGCHPAADRPYHVHHGHQCHARTKSLI
jgi:hypothetical protein